MMPLTSTELYLFKPAEEIFPILVTHYKFKGHKGTFQVLKLFDTFGFN